MKIGIIVHSRTGNTYSVATKLKEKLASTGHEVDLERLHVTGDEGARGGEAKIENPPDVSGYDALVFGAPVHGFALSKGMTIYLSQIQSLQNKKITCFVTKGLRFSWTGGNQAISTMKKLCESKGGTVCDTGFVVWSKDREQQIADLVERLSRCF